MLNVYQKDYLTELLNIGIGKSAAALSDLVGSKVDLKVPDIDVYNVDDIRKSFETSSDKKVAAVKQSFRGSFSGDAYLVFSVESGLQLAQRIMGDIDDNMELSAQLGEVLSEIGNIVINGFLGSWSHVFPNYFTYEVPEYIDSASQLLVGTCQDSTADEKQSVTVQAKASFEIEDIKVDGSILALFDVKSLETLIGNIDRTCDEVCQ